MANAIRNKKAPKRLMRAETPMSCRVAIDKHQREEKRERKRIESTEL